MKFLILFVIACFALNTSSIRADESNVPEDWEGEVWGACPKSLDTNVDLITSAVEKLLKKKDLARAAELGINCASWGSNNDVSILEPVNNAFTNELNKILPGKVQTAMESMLAKCEKRYKRPGSKGHSYIVHCQIKVLLGFDAVYGNQLLLGLADSIGT